MEVLVGDIGGTKTLLRVATMREGLMEIHFERHYQSSAFEDFTPLIENFLKEVSRACPGIAPERSCLAVAGPVSHSSAGDTAKVTNLPWELDAGAIGARFNIPHMSLINDFEAIAYGLDGLKVEDLLTIQKGRIQVHGPRLVMGAGTGLGVAMLVWQGNRYKALATEAGHMDYAPTSELQLALYRHLHGRLGHVSCERLLSGPGLANIYGFLLTRESPARPADKDLLITAPDPAAAISHAAIQDQDALACQALELFLTIYGAQAGNLALVSLPFAGVYIAGGIAAKISRQFLTGEFLHAFIDKGRMAPLLEQIPVSVIRDPQVGLIGAARVAAALT